MDACEKSDSVSLYSLHCCQYIFMYHILTINSIRNNNAIQERIGQQPVQCNVRYNY
jgi:peptidase E